MRIRGNNQLDSLFHVFIYFMSLHVSSATVVHHPEIELY